MNNSKIGAIFLIIVLSLATIAASYAGFTDTITITGNATTGSVDLELQKIKGTWIWKNIPNHERIIHRNQPASTEDLNDDGTPGDDIAADNQDPSWYEPGDYELYSYATAYAEENNKDVIHTTWHNLYPMPNADSWRVYVVFMKFEYQGKTPARINNLDFSWTGDPVTLNEGTPEEETHDNWMQYLYDNNRIMYNFFWDWEEQNPVEVCDQLHYGDTIFLVLKARIPQDNAFQDLSGEGSFTINLIQFDEADCDDTNTGGSIIVQKETIPDGEDILFEFDGSVDKLDGSIPDGEQIYADLSAGQYTIEEINIPNNWMVSDIQISGDEDSGSVIDICSNSTDIDLDNGEVITVTYTNTHCHCDECDETQNLIVNGGFEYPTINDHGGKWETFESNEVDWTVEWRKPGSTETPVLELQNENQYNPIIEGEQYAELDSHDRPDKETSVKISQTIDTCPSRRYELTFAFSPRPQQDELQNVLNVTINDEKVYDPLITADNPGSNNDWTMYSYEFIADSFETTIAFTDEGEANTFGTFIDDVQLHEICE